MRRTRLLVTALVLAGVTAATAPAASAGRGGSAPPSPSVRGTDWTEVAPSSAWAPRAGLQVVELRNRLLLMGGRTPNPPTGPIPIPGDSTIWADVWASDDRGASWEQLVATDASGHWPARAYFQAVTKGDEVFVLGGQDFAVIPNPACQPPGTPCPPGVPPFIPVSQFFNDVWASRDGVTWEQRTADAGWAGRAGLMAAVLGDELFVFGGSQNDDSSIIGGPPQRIYFDDVWKSRDGTTWELVTEHAPWAARAGGAAVVKDGYLYLLGGEVGFTCSPFPGCQLPYFNDVWRTRDGAHWELVTPAAGWSPRPGHQCEALQGELVCFGGFGLPTNPLDVWVSRDGSDWRQVSSAPWDAVSPDEAKYDFAALAVPGGPGGQPPSILTFGGDRETFDFSDPTNYLRVDNDVWRVQLERGRPG